MRGDTRVAENILWLGAGREPAQVDAEGRTAVPGGGLLKPEPVSSTSPSLDREFRRLPAGGAQGPGPSPAYVTRSAEGEESRPSTGRVAQQTDARTRQNTEQLRTQADVTHTPRQSDAQTHAHNTGARAAGEAHTL